MKRLFERTKEINWIHSHTKKEPQQQVRDKVLKYFTAAKSP